MISLCIFGNAIAYHSCEHLRDLQVSVPPDQLASVYVTGPTSVVAVAPGFTVSNLNLATAAGAAELDVLDIVADTVEIQSGGCA